VLAVVLADTHIRSGSNRRLPDLAYAALERADVVLHAGDIVDGGLLDELSRYAPVHAVLGNNDRDVELPETLVVDLDGVSVAMIHDSGPRAGRETRLHKRFADADVVVFGHSHIPWNAPGVGGQLLFNPGSAVERRRQPRKTLGLLECADGAVVRHQICAVD
jgi:putative phosphoesterase